MIFTNGYHSLVQLDGVDEPIRLLVVLRVVGNILTAKLLASSLIVTSGCATALPMRLDGPITDILAAKCGVNDLGQSY
jgi:hypothetical protein